MLVNWIKFKWISLIDYLFYKSIKGCIYITPPLYEEHVTDKGSMLFVFPNSDNKWLLTYSDSNRSPEGYFWSDMGVGNELDKKHIHYIKPILENVLNGLILETSVDSNVWMIGENNRTPTKMSDITKMTTYDNKTQLLIVGTRGLVKMSESGFCK